MKIITRLYKGEVVSVVTNKLSKKVNNPMPAPKKNETIPKRWNGWRKLSVR